MKYFVRSRVLEIYIPTHKARTICALIQSELDLIPDGSSEIRSETVVYFTIKKTDSEFHPFLEKVHSIMSIIGLKQVSS